LRPRQPGEPESSRPKSFTVRILISKFFENQILRGLFSRNPRWTRILGHRKEKLSICDLTVLQAIALEQPLAQQFIPLRNPHL